jgi:lactoylglutathione lyase
MAKATDKDGSLKRLGGGRWQTRDARFTIEPQSGTWVVVDAQQSDDLGLALVRGPFASLAAAKDAIAAAREAEPAVSPLAAQVAKLHDRRAAAPPKAEDRPRSSPPLPTRPEPAGVGPPARPEPPAEPEPAAEPRWLRDLEPIERRRARELIARLTEGGATDAEGIARRDVVGKVPAAAAFAIARALAGLGPKAPPAEVVRLLAAGRDAALGVRWRLVDDEDRPIALDRPEQRLRSTGRRKEQAGVLETRLVVTAPDYDEALAFYRDVLGMRELGVFSSPGGRVTILEGGRATLELADPPHAAYVDDVEVGRRVAGHIRVAFQVPDAESATDRLVAGGAELIARPVETPWRSLNARLDGPAGLQLTLFEELDPT